MNWKITSKLLLLILLAGILKITGCEQEDLNSYSNCDDCIGFIPDSADLIVDVTINGENPFVPLTFYIGDYENGQVDYVDTAWTNTLYLYSEIGISYSVMARYFKGEDTIYVVDGDKMRVVNGDDECYYPCYFIRGGTLDLPLK